MCSSVRHKSGFTLIELLIVMVIIGILAAVLLPNMLGMRERARDSRLKSEMAQLKTALQIYYSDFQRYPAHDPAHDTGGQIMGCGSAGLLACTWGGEFSATQNGTTRIYMAHLPNVHAASGSIAYLQPSTNDQTYLLGVTLENASDSDIAASATRCGVSSPTTDYYYICP